MDKSFHGCRTELELEEIKQSMQSDATGPHGHTIEKQDYARGLLPIAQSAGRLLAEWCFTASEARTRLIRVDI